MELHDDSKFGLNLVIKLEINKFVNIWNIDEIDSIYETHDLRSSKNITMIAETYLLNTETYSYVIES